MVPGRITFHKAKAHNLPAMEVQIHLDLLGKEVKDKVAIKIRAHPVDQGLLLAMYNPIYSNLIG